MKRNIIWILAGVTTLALAFGGAPSPAGAEGPDGETEYQTPAPPPDAPGAASWTCPKCGAECQGPFARRGFAKGAPHAGRGRGDAMRRHGMGMRGGHGGGLAADRLVKGAGALELTDAQVEQLKQLAFDARSQMIDLKSDLEKARLEMRRQMETNRDDFAALKKQLDAVSKKRASIQELRLKNWVDARKVLTDEQKKTMDDKMSRGRAWF